MAALRVTAEIIRLGEKGNTAVEQTAGFTPTGCDVESKVLPRSAKDRDQQFTRSLGKIIREIGIPLNHVSQESR